MNNISLRKNKLNTILQNTKTHAFITTSTNWIHYFTGCLLDKANPAILIIKEDMECILIAPEGTATEESTVMDYCIYSVEELQNPVNNISKVMKQIIDCIGTKISFQMQETPAWLFTILTLGGKNLQDISDELSDIAMIKDDVEIEAIKNTLKLNALAYDEVRKHLKAGITEMELYSYVTGAFNKEAGFPVECICDLISGERTLEIGGKPTNRVIRENESVIVDILPTRCGYYSDTTRTFFTGKPRLSQYNAYGTLLAAMNKGEQILRPGSSAEDIYYEVSKTIEKNGYSPMPHHAGHGIGMNSFEAPYFIKKSEKKLVPGMVVTIEPGIYVPGDFGMRVENNYLITEDGFSLLFDYPKDIEHFII